MAKLAITLANEGDHCFVVDLKAVPVAHGQRIHTQAMVEAQVSKGALGGFAGFKLAVVIDSRGLFVHWALLPGNSHENDAERFNAGMRGYLGGEGFP